MLSLVVVAVAALARAFTPPDGVLLQPSAPDGVLLQPGAEEAASPCSCQPVLYMNGTKCLWTGMAAAASTTTGSASTRMTVLLHGEVFRNGTSGGALARTAANSRFHQGTSLDSESIREQGLALQSIAAHVVAPLRSAGWNVSIALNAVTHDGAAGEALLHSQGSRHFATAHVRVRHGSLDSQAEDILQVLRWVRTACAECAGGALLLLRIDLVMLAPLRVPSPAAFADATTLLYPWYDSYDRTSGNRRLLNDVLTFVPASSRDTFEHALHGAIEGRKPLGFDPQTLLNVLPEGELAICVLYDSVVDPNSERAFNPVYRMCSRTRCPDPSIGAADAAGAQPCPSRNSDIEANAMCSPPPYLGPHEMRCSLLEHMMHSGQYPTPPQGT